MLKFRGRALQIALLAQREPLFNMRFTRFKAGLIQFDSDLGITWISGERLLVILNGGIVILKGFRSLACIVLLPGLRAACGQQACPYTLNQFPPTCHAISVT